MTNAPFPCLDVTWTLDADGRGWYGHCVVWTDPNTKFCAGHTIGLRQTMPLGMISVELDGCKGGAWKFHSFEGCRLDERDLQWATSWAILAIEDNHHFNQNECRFAASAPAPATPGAVERPPETCGRYTILDLCEAAYRMTMPGQTLCLRSADLDDGAVVLHVRHCAPCRGLYDNAIAAYGRLGETE